MRFQDILDELVLKEHPSQPGALNTSNWKEIIKHERVHKVFGTHKIDSLLQLPDSIVVSLGSTMVLEAALNGARCVVVGEVHFADAPGITKDANIREWPKCLDDETVSSQDILNWYSLIIYRNVIFS